MMRISGSLLCQIYCFVLKESTCHEVDFSSKIKELVKQSNFLKNLCDQKSYHGKSLCIFILTLIVDVFHVILVMDGGCHCFAYCRI